MENVPLLAKQTVFSSFVCSLEEDGFHVSHKVVDCADYGVPQHRQRLVLLASKLGGGSGIYDDGAYKSFGISG